MIWILPWFYNNDFIVENDFIINILFRKWFYFIMCPSDFTMMIDRNPFFSIELSNIFNIDLVVVTQQLLPHLGFINNVTIVIYSMRKTKEPKIPQN